MVAIFEHRNIEKNDLRSQLKFPAKINDILTNLSPEDRRNLSSAGKSSTLDVKDDRGNIHELTVEKGNDGIYFTDGWNEFKNGKGIEENDKISLFKEDNHFDCGDKCTYRIEVEKAERAC
ncbi:hypothetical protein SLA2020_324480 [Shorea laevis]